MKYGIKIIFAAAPIVAAGYFLRKFLILYLGYLPAFALTILFMGGAEILLFSALKLLDPKALLSRFFGKRQKRKAAKAGN